MIFYLDNRWDDQIGNRDLFLKRSTCNRNIPLEEALHFYQFLLSDQNGERTHVGVPSYEWIQVMHIFFQENFNLDKKDIENMIQETDREQYSLEFI